MYLQVWLTLKKPLLYFMGRGAHGVCTVLDLTLFLTLLPYTITFFWDYFDMPV